MSKLSNLVKRQQTNYDITYNFIKNHNYTVSDLQKISALLKCNEKYWNSPEQLLERSLLDFYSITPSNGYPEISSLDLYKVQKIKYQFINENS